MITGNIDTLELNGVMDDYISLEGTMLTYGPKGDKGDKGDPGDPGFSPIAIVEETSSGATITITDSVGTTSASVLNGTDGEDGQDGYSPIATVTKSGDTATISITDKNGTTTATVSDGADGQDGAPGADGFSPSASVSKSGSVTTISVTDKEGTTTATVNDGINGTNGQDGEDGEDGFSPIATVTKSGKIATISITDASGTTTAEIRDGEDGQGSGDMLKATYDTNDNGIVDNAEKVNNHTVLSDVPANAVFTDTTYTAGTGIDITNGVISNTQTSAEWGNISGTLSNQTDLNTALSGKADSSSLATVATSGSYADLSNKPTIPTKVSDLTNDSGFVTTTDYADSATGGVIKTNSSYGNYITDGFLAGWTRTAAQYNSDSNSLLVSKGTLENVITDKGLMRSLFVAEYGTTSWSDVKNAIDNNKVVYCKVTSGSSYRMAFLAYYGSSSAEFQYYRSIDPHTASQQGDQVIIYKITSGNSWTTTTREASSKIVAGTNMGSSYSSGTLTLTADDEVAIQTTQPSGPETIWINPDESVNPGGSGVISQTLTITGTLYQAGAGFLEFTAITNMPSGWNTTNSFVAYCQIFNNTHSHVIDAPFISVNYANNQFSPKIISQTFIDNAHVGATYWCLPGDTDVAGDDFEAIITICKYK